MRIGILALQGAVEPHVNKLEELGVEATFVRRASHLSGLSAIILPGGESTTMLHLLRLNDLWEPLRRFVREYPTYGVCAGAILLANEVTSPAQASLQAIDLIVERNAFGRQTCSFTAQLEPTSFWDKPAVEGVFIRAPRIRRMGSGVKTLMTCHGEPVLVVSKNILLATFHSELTNSPLIHQYLLNLCGVNG